MKIYYLSASKIPSRAANSMQVMNMCNALSKEHDILLFACEGTNEGIDEFEYYDVGRTYRIIKAIWPNLRGLGGILFANVVFKKIMQEGLPDFFYGRDRYSIYAIRKLGVPFIFESHLMPQNYFKAKLEESILRSENLLRFVVTANLLKEQYRVRYIWLNDDKIVVAPNASVNMKRKMSESEERKDLFSTGGDRSLKIGYVGNLYPGKGMEITIKLAGEFHDVEFHIIGGSKEDIRYWSSKHNNENIFYHGFINRKLLPGYYKMLDVLIAPYQKHVNTPSPLKLIEYMSTGKPIIASDLFLSKETLQNEFDSLLCPPDNINKWIDAVNRLKDDLSLRQKLGKNAYNKYLIHYSWESRVDKILSNVIK